MLQSSNFINSTSTRKNRLASMASKEKYIGVYDKSALVYQFRSSMTHDPDREAISAFEEKYSKVQSDLPLDTDESLTEVLPSDTDYPVGFTFNAYNTINEIYGAYPFTAQHYPNMANTPFDLGNHFSDSDDVDGQGETLTFWLRASARSQGYVFSLTDYYEVTESGANPILELAHQIIESGRNSTTAWFASDFHVYYAVYLDGPARLLRLIIADPVDKSQEKGIDPIHIVEWRLSDIGQTVLLNDQWHQVRIIFSNMHGRVMVQLVIDGVTSYGNNGWNHCLGTKRFTKIVDLPSEVKIRDKENEAVFNGGLMTIGYFNGGVWGVEVGNEPIPRGSLKAHGVDKLRDLNSDNKSRGEDHCRCHPDVPDFGQLLDPMCARHGLRCPALRQERPQTDGA